MYDISNERAIDFGDGDENHFVSSKNLNNDNSKMRFHVIHYRWIGD